MSPDSASLFKGTAWYYARYRRPYPEQVFNAIVAYYRLDGRGRLLDLGCGTGEVTVPLAKHFTSAVGIDPSVDMLAEAEERAKREKTDNIRWIEGKAEDIESSFGLLRLTTAGVSFHWMDKPKVLGKVYELTEDGGGMAILADISPVRGKSKIEDWKMKRKEMIEKYLGAERRAGDYLHKDFIPEKRPYEELIVESPFKSFEMREYFYTTERNIDEVMGFLNSTSYANRRLLGERADKFEKELRAELLRLAPSNKFVEEGKTDIFFLRK